MTFEAAQQQAERTQPDQQSTTATWHSDCTMLPVQNAIASKPVSVAALDLIYAGSYECTHKYSADCDGTSMSAGFCYIISKRVC